MKRKQPFRPGETKHFWRLKIVAIAVLTVFAAVIIPAKLLGEFDWHLPF